MSWTTLGVHVGRLCFWASAKLMFWGLGIDGTMRNMTLSITVNREGTTMERTQHTTYEAPSDIWPDAAPGDPSGEVKGPGPEWTGRGARELEDFRQAMQQKLDENNHKPHWSTHDLSYLLMRLELEHRELEEKIDEKLIGVLDPSSSEEFERWREEARMEAADVANIAMMIYDNLGRESSGAGSQKEAEDLVDDHPSKSHEATPKEACEEAKDQ